MKHFFQSITALGLLAGLAACGSDGTYSQADGLDLMAPPSPAPMVREMKMASASADRVEVGENAASGPQMAYRYNYGITLPAQNVEATMQNHMELCTQAGTQQCQVLNASSNSRSADYTNAYLSLRASPEWLDRFQLGLEDNLDKVSGRISESSVSAEDLTRRIFDADARLDAQSALRQRLLDLLKTRNADLQALLSVERELARVQAEVESATAQLKTLRERVAMSVVDLRYDSRPKAVSQSALSPVADALRGFLGTISEGLAAVIVFIAVILPWLIFVIAPGLFLLRWLWRRRRAAKA